MKSIDQLPKQSKVLNGFNANPAQAHELLSLRDEDRTNYPSSNQESFNPAAQPPANEQELIDGMLKGNYFGDTALSKMQPDQVQSLLSQGKNGGSKTVDLIKQQMIANQMAQPKDDTPDEAKPEDELKQLYKQLAKQEFQRYLQPTQNPVTTVGDIMPAFQRNKAEGLNKLAQYLNTSQGQNVISGLMGALGNKNAQLAYGRGASQRVPAENFMMERAAMEDAQRERGIDSILKSYITSTSPKSGASYKNAIDDAYAKNQITPEMYETLKTTSDYTGDTFLPSSVLNKRIEPFLIKQRYGNAVNLEGVKQGNRKEIADYTQPQKIEIANVNAQNQANLKGNVAPAQTPDQARKIAAEAKIAEQKAKGEDPKAKENMNNLMNLNVRLKSLGELIDSPNMPNPLTGISGYGHSAYRKLVKPNTTEKQFDTAIQSLKLLIPQVLDKTGKKLSNTEIIAIEKSLPSLNDTYENKKAAYNATYQQLVDRFNIEQGTLKSIPGEKSTLKAGQKIGRFEIVKVSE